MSDQNIYVDNGGEPHILRRVCFADISGDEWIYLTNRFDLDPLTIIYYWCIIRNYSGTVISSEARARNLLLLS